MRILVVGAGAIGGYFGGRLLQAGRDITFLVRPRRASELSSAGLVIKSPNGDVTLKNPPTVQADAIKDKFDVVLLSCKAYDLEDAVKSFAPAVGPQTSIIPLLNGMLHLDVLDKRFGRERVLGGLCAIAVTLNEKREVVHLQPMQSLGFGERDGKMSDRVRAIGEVFSAIEGASASGHVMQDMWEKWVFLASIAAATCLMRAPVGMIPAARILCWGSSTNARRWRPRKGFRHARPHSSARRPCSPRKVRRSPPRCSATSRRTCRSKPTTWSAT